MFDQSSYLDSDAYEKEKLRILQTLNTQLTEMAVKLDRIVTYTEQVYFNDYKKPVNVKISKVSFNNNNNNNHKTGLISSTFSSSHHHHHHHHHNNNSSSSYSNENSLNMSPSDQKSSDYKPSETTAKRNKQQRQFNTFVRESINQLLGPDYMRTHDVQDIDQAIMEKIRKQAVDEYLPDNIRPRRAWHLAKASLRTLKRTLNNKKTATDL